MILLHDNFLYFELPDGQSVPFSAEMVSVELSGAGVDQLDQEFVQHATASVFHYFKNDLAKKSVTLAEFAAKFETVLNGLGLRLEAGRLAGTSDDGATKDLHWLASHAGAACELAFFPRLRLAVHAQYQLTPRLVSFHGLRGCVKRLLGAERWSPRCDSLRDQIVDYLRQTVRKETAGNDCALLVE
jgi:hypothetical protein